MGSVEETATSAANSTTQKESLANMKNHNYSELCDNDSCAPITSFEELMKFGHESCTENTRSRVEALCKDKVVGLSSNFSKSKISYNGKFEEKNGKVPLTLVCHDLKGGYGDDRFVNGAANMENYTYRHWLLTDIFVYFSHKFVTIPPLGWINAAHSHGVKILGTIITEWNDGAELCTKILSSQESIDETIEKLCKINTIYGFDGYLLNIENKLKGKEQVEKMVEFTKKLTQALKKLSPHNLVIWYDSVIASGDLKWQDELNEKNKIFFDVCDGIYLNYNWNDTKLQNSVKLAGDRRYDVFAGIDCWGRGCWGGGGVNTCLAVDKISPHELSYAFFAPGWTYESHTFREYPFIDDELWTKCMKHLHFRCVLGSEVSVNQNKNNSNFDQTDNNTEQFQVFVSTDFSRGYGTKKFSFGKIISDVPWFDLSKQSFQPVIFCSTKCLEYDCAPLQEKFAKTDDEKKKEGKPSAVLIGSEQKIVYDTENAFSGGGALKILNSKKRKDFEDPLTSSPIWIPLNISISASRLTLATIAIWKSVSIHHQLKIYLELGKDGCLNRKILLGSLDSLATSVRGKFFIRLQLSQFLQKTAEISSEESDKNDLQFYFQKNNYDEKELNGWRVSCFLFDIDQVYDEYSSIKSLRVGADGDISLGFLGFGQITHYQQ